MSEAQTFSHSVEALALVTAPDLSVAMSDRTFRYHDPFHGAQFEYYSADGSAHLWYPGNKISVASTWRVQGERTQAGDGRQLCFVYGPRIFNPITNTWGGAPECEPVSKALLFIQESVEGDVFNLKSGQVPWVLVGVEPRTIDEFQRLLRSPFRFGRRY